MLKLVPGSPAAWYVVTFSILGSDNLVESPATHCFVENSCGFDREALGVRGLPIVFMTFAVGSISIYEIDKLVVSYAIADLAWLNSCT